MASSCFSNDARPVGSLHRKDIAEKEVALVTGSRTVVDAANDSYILVLQRGALDDLGGLSITKRNPDHDGRGFLFGMLVRGGRLPHLAG